MQICMPKTVQTAIQRLEQAGFEAYAVGGCVRDTIIGREPNDWDITTSARPNETAAVFSDCRTVETGVRHGTLTVILDGMPLEITTYRSDGEYADNRHPIEVTFSERVEDDLSRRDFTVNAMAYHPTRGLVDLYGGQADLERRVIACVGEPSVRFHEDGLRILRAIRFAAVLDFEIDPLTARAVHDCKDLLQNIAPERIREEFCKLICGKGAVRILREYIDVIGVFLPELERCVGFAQNTHYHCFDVYEHCLQALGHCRSADVITRLAVLLHDVGKPLCYTEDERGGHFKGHGDIGTELAESIARRLRFDNQSIESLRRLVEYHDRAIPPTPVSVKRLMLRMSDEDVLRLMEVQRCDRLAHAPAYTDLSPALEEIPRLMQAIREADECLSLKKLAVKGDDLMKIGIPAGKRMGEILNLLLDAVIDEKLPNERETLLRAALEYQKN